ncbi:hypothetical protein NC652_007398 [Populus alba x Populus x berolinensis]|nr:hypothetical protein NC652_007398 [Populus alba x Populus x berolinensis]
MCMLSVLRVRYKTWLWWSRFALAMTLLQTATAIYLVFSVAEFMSHNGTSSKCLAGTASNGNKWKTKLLIPFVITVCSVPLMHCFVGPAVLRWRSFYETQDDAWKAHYQEVFDHGIREALCCLSTSLSNSSRGAPKEDEVYSVARLLGDLVAYRASGTGHLELLAGLALLQRHGESPKSYDEMVEAPREKIREAFAFHQFAEAPYTGPLLDFGRHTIFFPCAWLYRHGILTPCTRNRRPSLSGDNWWWSHAAAFSKYVNLPREALRHGRVCQLYKLYPTLHVYAYGPLPCVELVIAEACSEFVTSEASTKNFTIFLPSNVSVVSFDPSAALYTTMNFLQGFQLDHSYGSALLAIVALAQDSKADKALICRLARQFLFVSMNQRGRIEVVDPSELHSAATTVEELDHKDYVDRTNSGGDTDDDNFENPFYDKAAVMNSLDDPVSQFLETVPRAEKRSAGDDAEMFLPGLVIHMVPQQRHVSMPFWKGWSVQELL